MFENKKRRATIRCLFSTFGYRQVTIHVNKQEQFTPPYGREPSELLALTCEYFAGIQSRERQEQKAQVILKRLRTGMRRTIHWLVIKCLSVPFGSAAPGAVRTPFMFRLYCLFRIFSLFDVLTLLIIAYKVSHYF